jgi:hypothetical protein
MSDIGDDLIRGMENAPAHARGKKRAARETLVAILISKRVAVAPIRRKLPISQDSFEALWIQCQARPQLETRHSAP